jgi:hypothetical protein
VVPLAHGGELKNREVPVLNMTSIGKCHHKKSLEKMWTLGPSRSWDARYRVQLCTYNSITQYKHHVFMTQITSLKFMLHILHQIIDVDAAFGCWHPVEVDCVASVSDGHTASIIRDKVSNVWKYMVYIGTGDGSGHGNTKLYEQRAIHT